MVHVSADEMFAMIKVNRKRAEQIYKREERIKKLTEYAVSQFLNRG